MSSIKLQGPLTITTLGDAQARLLGAGSEPLDLDLSEVSEIDSAGVQLLLWASYRWAPLTVAAKSAPVAEVLSLLGLPNFGAPKEAS